MYNKPYKQLLCKRNKTKVNQTNINKQLTYQNKVRKSLIMKSDL